MAGKLSVVGGVVPGVDLTTVGAPQHVDVAVIGAGQAGLSVAYHLRRRGFRPLAAGDAGGGQSHGAGGGGRGDDAADAGAARSGEAADGPRTFVVLDTETAPGGAWRHRWDTLTMATVNGIHDLPGMVRPEPDPAEPANAVLPDYFAAFEARYGLGVRRPVRVRRVERADDDPRGRLIVRTGPGDDPERGDQDDHGQAGDGHRERGDRGSLDDAGDWSAGAVLNATGTWRSPLWPAYPGQRDFAGRQLHTADYRGPQEFAGRHVVVVGGGISAVQHLEEISHVASTTWVTRREPVFRDGPFDAEAGREAVEMVAERVREGLPPRSVVSVTGLVWTPALRAAAARGVLRRHPMFERIEPGGVRWADGGFQRADVILWATGFRPHLAHLGPLGLREPGGGIRMDGTQVAAEPRVHLLGYGPSSSTIGANRAGREAARRIEAWLDGDGGSGSRVRESAGAR